IELTIAENITFGNDNIEEKWNFFRNVIIGKANEMIPKKKKLISGKYEESKALHNYFITYRKLISIRKIHEWGRQWYTNRKQKSILEEKIVKKIKNIREEYNIEIEVPS
ncbi:8094_t:CDS:1, partial [Dentiscutata erythropus]